MPRFTALVTLLAVIVYFWTVLRVGQARTKFGIKPPATTGNPEFEQIFRVQMNTLEWMPIFLPAMWLAALFGNDMFAAAVGLVWIAGRVLYVRDYTLYMPDSTHVPANRGSGFFVQTTAVAMLWVSALVGVIRSMLPG